MTSPSASRDANPDLNDDAVDPTVWRTVGVVLVGAMAVLFDTTIVAVALHTLATDLHTSVSTIQWVSTGYLLAMAVTVPIAGWAQRVLGGKRLWMFALALFLVGSVLASLAWNPQSLIAFRVVQGVGGGFLAPLMSTLVMQAAGGRNIGRIMAVVSLPAVLGPILGPVLGGLILQHLHWSWMFWVNVPFCVAGLILAARVLPADGPVLRAPLDVVGVALLAPGLVGVLWGLSNTIGTGGFARADALVPIAAGLASLGAFVAWALRHRAAALVNLLLLKHWPLASASLLLFLSGLTLYGAMLLLPLYFQELRGTTALQAGLLLIPQGLGTLISRPQAGRLSDTLGARWLVATGFVIVAIGTLPFAFAGAHTSYVLLTLALLVRGIGLGLVVLPLMALGFRGLERSQVPDASIITRIAQQVGGSFGTAVLAVILTSTPTTTTSPAALEHAFHQSFWWALGFTAAGILIAVVLPRTVPDTTPTAPTPTVTNSAQPSPTSAP